MASLGACAQKVAIPAQFRGHWAGSPAQCGSVHEARLTIHGDRVDFYESRGRILSVKPIGALEVELEMESTGEGETWRQVRRFVLSEDKRTLTDVTYESHMTRVRCD